MLYYSFQTYLVDILSFQEQLPCLFFCFYLKLEAKIDNQVSLSNQVHEGFIMRTCLFFPVKLFSYFFTSLISVAKNTVLLK